MPWAVSLLILLVVAVIILANLGRAMQQDQQRRTPRQTPPRSEGDNAWPPPLSLPPPSAPLGALPPLKIHCAQLVEEALRSALAPGSEPKPEKSAAPTLLQRMQSLPSEKKKIVLKTSNE